MKICWWICLSVSWSVCLSFKHAIRQTTDRAHPLVRFAQPCISLQMIMVEWTNDILCQNVNLCWLCPCFRIWLSLKSNQQPAFSKRQRKSGSSQNKDALRPTPGAWLSPLAFQSIPLGLDPLISRNSGRYWLSSRQTSNRPTESEKERATSVTRNPHTAKKNVEIQFPQRSSI